VAKSRSRPPLLARGRCVFAEDREMLVLSKRDRSELNNKGGKESQGEVPKEEKKQG